MNIKELKAQILHSASDFNGQYSLAIETDGGQIYINAERRIPSASLIKIPIMLEAFRQAQAGALMLDEICGIDAGQRVGGSGIVQYMSPDLPWPLKDLISLMILVSDNTAANFLIDRLGMERINALIRRMNCQNTVLARKMMDFEARNQGLDNFTSAADMLSFFREIIRGSILDEERRSAAYKMLTWQQFNSGLPGHIPEGRAGELELAHKTGDLPGVEHDAGIFKVKGNYAYAAVLTWGLPAKAAGREFIANIGKAVFEYLLS